MASKEIQASLSETFMLCIWVIMFGLSMIVLATMCVACFTGWRIAKPVKDMTDYTNQMKVAPSLAMKISIVKKTAQDPSFAEVSLQYHRMKAAKDNTAVPYSIVISKLIIIKYEQ